MLTFANVSAAQAENYYEKDDYYTQGDPDLESDTKWHGQGAHTLHLEDPVDQQQFQQLLHGQTPAGKSLHSRQIDPSNHRAATDYTFSAPKSVSIAALIQKDKRVIQAHDQAVTTALSVLESRYAQTRVRRGPGIRDRVQTGNIIAATFRHETSREQDPQLHTHCVIINATQLADGRWQSMANEEVLNNQKLLGEIYQNELAVQLRRIGYEIEPQGNGLFECKGYAEPLRDLFSTRTQQIEQYIERWEAALKESGGKPLHAKQKKQATLATRLRKKTVPREVLLEGWHRAIASSDIYLPALPEKAPEPIATQATLSATAGVSHAAERESVFKREKAERFALEHHLGEQSFAELQSAMTGAGLIAAKNRYTTTGAIARELDTIAIMESGQGQADTISDDSQIEQMLSSEPTLTDGQRQAIQTTAQSRDQVMAWQGVAGAGKTYSLKLLAQLATEQSYAVTGYAPSAEAATVLQTEADIESMTVARLLHSRQTEVPEKAIWIVDEAGLLSAKDAHALLEKAQSEKARVILVGDTRQLSAVEAGNPFKSLQSAGMKTAYLEESRRQKTDALRTAVVCLAAGEQREGLERLDRAGMVHQVESREGRHHAICRDYLSLSPEAREKTLILSGTNVERLALTAELRAALQAEGSLGADAFTLRSLRPLDRTASQLQYACAYEVGDVVVPVRDYHRYGMDRRVQYRVIDRDLETNRLTLKGPAGESFSFDPATCATKTTYAVQEIAIAPGDQLRWTRNEAVPGVRNGQTVTVEAIDAKGTATVSGAKGETMTLELTGQQYLDYALVSTTYSSQGKTADRVLADIDSTLSKEGLYVAVSRAKSNLRLYTADKPQLYKRAERSAAKENPSDYLPLFKLVNPDAESKKAARAARDLRGADQSEYLGDSAGKRVEVSYEAAVRRDRAAAAGSERAESRTGGLIPQYVSDVRGVVAGIEERRRAEALERQAERTREAAQGIINGARQLELTATAIARLDEQLERQAERLSRRSLPPALARASDFQTAICAFSDGLSKPQVIALLAKQSPETQRCYREEGSTPAYQYAEGIATAAQRANHESYDFKEAGRRIKPTNVNGVAESILKGIDLKWLERVKSRSAEIKTSEPPVEKRQELVKCQQQPKQRQKERDHEMEL